MYITATRYIAYHQRIHRIHHNLRQRNADCRSNSDHIKVSIKIQFANFFHAIAKYFDKRDAERRTIDHHFHHQIHYHTKDYRRNDQCIDHVHHHVYKNLR